MRNINDFHKIYIAFQFGPVSPSICTISACAAPTTRTAIKKLFTIISCDIINWKSIFYSWLCGLNVNGMPYKFSDWRKDYFGTILNSERTREKSSFPLWVIYMTSWFFENLEYFLQPTVTTYFHQNYSPESPFGCIAWYRISFNNRRFPMAPQILLSLY